MRQDNAEIMKVVIFLLVLLGALLILDWRSGLLTVALIAAIVGLAFTIDRAVDWMRKKS